MFILSSFEVTLVCNKGDVKKLRNELPVLFSFYSTKCVIFLVSVQCTQMSMYHMHTRVPCQLFLVSAPHSFRLNNESFS